MVSKYIRIYYHLFKQSLVRELQYRFNFMAGTLVELAWAALRIIFYLVSFNHITQVGEWTIGKSLVLTGTFLLVQAVFKVVFETNFMRFPHVLYNGELDTVLVKPISAQFLVTTRSMSPMSIARIFLSASIICLGLVQSSWHVSVAGLLLYLYSLLISLVLMYSIHFIGFCLLFWLGYVDNIHFMTRVFVGQTYIPLDIFPRFLSEFFTFVVPLAFIAMIPAKTLYTNTLGMLAVGTVLGVLLFAGSRWLWHQGLKNYSSVSG